MKISLSAIRALGYADLLEVSIEQLVEKIGAQLGALEAEPEYLGSLYEGVTVVKIVRCADHPNADKLHICLIDDGGVTANVARDDNGHIQVVC
ncbi:MAG TPA: hypothetical protein VFN56_00555, partial [Candidatus Saccharimonadales bacterium]|nr:hypothetical protein [Candidatus Saccharimonadales bacterium]